MWANHVVIRRPLAIWEAALTQLRAMGTRLAENATFWDVAETIPSAAIAELHAMCEYACEARITFQELSLPMGPTHVWTDASERALGWVLEDHTQGRQLMTTRSHTFGNIFTAELYAAVLGVYNVPPGSTIHVDNRAALAALEKGHSRTRGGNILIRALALQGSSGGRFGACWVPSGCNRADAVSRSVLKVPQFLVSCPHESEVRGVRWRMPAKEKGGIAVF